MKRGRGSSTGFLLVRGLLRGLLRLLFRVEVRGPERIPTEGYILVANHLNWIDGFLLLAMLPSTPRLYVLADKHAICKTWWKRWIVAAMGRVITIDRSNGHGDGSAMRTVYRVLGRGDALALFPEGSTDGEEGRLLRLQRGIGALCLRSGRPVLPVGLSGVSELYWGKEITLTVGQTFTPTSVESTMARRIDDVTGQVQRALEQTLPRYSEKPVAQKRMRWLTDLLK